MEELTLILSAIAAVASILSAIIALRSNASQKQHLKHRYEALNEEYNGFFGSQIDPTGRDKVRIEMNTIKKDLGIK